MKNIVERLRQENWESNADGIYEKGKSFSGIAITSGENKKENAIAISLVPDMINSLIHAHADLEGTLFDLDIAQDDDNEPLAKTYREIDIILKKLGHNKTYDEFKRTTVDPPISFFDKKEIVASFDIGYYYKEAADDLQNNINKLNDEFAGIKEMKYLSDFFTEIKNALQGKRGIRRSYVSHMEIDINKLKYCKTLLSYSKRAYSEELLCSLDYIQDQIAENIPGIEEDLFYFPNEK